MSEAVKNPAAEFLIRIENHCTSSPRSVMAMRIPGATSRQQGVAIGMAIQTLKGAIKDLHAANAEAGDLDDFLIGLGIGLVYEPRHVEGSFSFASRGKSGGRS